MVSLGDSPKPLMRERRRLCTRSCISSLVWFIAGIFTVLIALQIQAHFDYRIPFLSEAAALPSNEDHHQSQSSPSPLHTRKQTQTITHTQTHTETSTTTTTASAIHTPTTQPHPDPNPNSPLPWSQITKLFAFGDSYTSTSFNPHGRQPSLKNPLGNHKKNTPPNWLQFLSTVHNASHLQTYDFALGGSTVDRKVAKPFLLGSTFREQIRDGFKANYVGRKAKERWAAESSVFLVWFGVNDLYAPRVRNEKPLPAVKDVVRSYEAGVGELYKLGARRVVLFTLPPFERSTGLEIGEKRALNMEIVAFNARVLEMRGRLRERYPELRISVFDAFGFWARVIDAPGDFEETATVTRPKAICGIAGGWSPKPFPEKDPLSAKCKVGFVKEYIWYGLHGTFTVHNATARRVASDCFGEGGVRGFCL